MRQKGTLRTYRFELRGKVGDKGQGMGAAASPCHPTGAAHVVYLPMYDNYNSLYKSAPLLFTYKGAS